MSAFSLLLWLFLPDNHQDISPMEVIQTTEQPETKRTRLRRIAVDILLFFVLCILMNFFFALLLLLLPKVEVSSDSPMSNTFRFMMEELLMLLCVLSASRMVLKVRGMPFSRLGLSLKGRWKDVLTGMLFAVAIYAAGFGLALGLNAVEVSAVSFHPSSLTVGLILFFLVSVTEEVMVRGFVLGRMMDGGVNKFVALLISAVLFSLLHVFNPNFEFVSFLNILLAGVLLGASYIYTRNLCFPLALHWFWNWLQGPVLGYEVSGNRFEGSLFTLYLPEHNLMNGGNFGFEGSLLCTVLTIAGTALIIRHYSNSPNNGTP